MLSFLNIVLCVLVSSVPSEDGMPVDGFENFDVGSGVTVDQLLPFCASLDADTIADIDPGVLPEGDYLMDITFTNDGSKVLVCNYMSENITVMDWASMSVDTTFAVDGHPGGIACSYDYAVVAVPFSNRIDVFNLTDYSLAGSFAVGEQPWVVRISDDGAFAYVACDIDNVCEVIDLSSLTHSLTIVDFPIWLCSVGWGSESNRYYVKFSGFEVLPGGVHIAVGDGISSLLFFNTSVGNIEYTLPVTECDNVALSGDGAYLVALSTTNPVALSRIDLSTIAVDSVVTVTGYTSGMTREIAVNQDGTKAYISTSSNTSTLVRFLTNDFYTYGSTYSAFWIGVSPDHSLAVSGQNRYSIIDFASEIMVAQFPGNNQYSGCVSPVANNTASYSPFGFEGALLYSFDGSSITYRGGVLSGSEIEGDGTRRTSIAPDGSVCVVSNTMSDNVSIIDLATLAVDAVLEIGDRVQDVAITSDSKWAVVCGFNSNSVKIIDLETYTIVADVPTGTRSSVVSITPDDGYAYVGNVSANTVSVVQLDGASSVEIAEIPCGVIGVVWAACGVTSDVRVSPSGDYCLVAASFDDKVKVIDTATNTIVADLDVGEFPLQIAFNADGSRAIVSNYFSDDYSLINVDGASSSVVGTWNCGDAPMRVAYDSFTDQFAVGLYSDKMVKMVDPSTGAITGTYSYTSSGSVLDLDFDADDGSRLVLTAAGSSTPCRLHRDSEYDDLSGSAVYFDYSDAIGTAVAAVPGPDYGIVVTWTPEGISEGTVGTAGMPGLVVSPNPGAGSFALSVYLPVACDVRLGVYDLSGRLVSTVSENSFSGGSHSFVWDAPVPAGVYAVRLDAGSKTVTRLITVCE